MLDPRARTKAPAFSATAQALRDLNSRFYSGEITPEEYGREVGPLLRKQFEEPEEAPFSTGPVHKKGREPELDEGVGVGGYAYACMNPATARGGDLVRPGWADEDND